jgi:hypothetical protein
MSCCTSCNRSDISARWAFCPRCGSVLTSARFTSTTAQSAATASPVGQPKELKSTLIDLALDAAQNLIRNKVDEKFSVVTQLLNRSDTAAAPSVSSTQWPQWYSTAVNGGQPQLDATERARLLAKEISDARASTQMAQTMMQHMKDMSNITKGGF